LKKWFEKKQPTKKKTKKPTKKEQALMKIIYGSMKTQVEEQKKLYNNQITETLNELDHLKETILLNIPDHYANVKVGDLCRYAGDNPISNIINVGNESMSADGEEFVKRISSYLTKSQNDN